MLNDRRNQQANIRVADYVDFIGKVVDENNITMFRSDNWGTSLGRPF